MRSQFKEPPKLQSRLKKRTQCSSRFVSAQCTRVITLPTESYVLFGAVCFSVDVVYLVSV